MGAGLPKNHIFIRIFYPLGICGGFLKPPTTLAMMMRSKMLPGHRLPRHERPRITSRQLTCAIYSSSLGKRFSRPCCLSQSKIIISRRSPWLIPTVADRRRRLRCTLLEMVTEVRSDLGCSATWNSSSPPELKLLAGKLTYVHLFVRITGTYKITPCDRWPLPSAILTPRYPLHLALLRVEEVVK